MVAHLNLKLICKLKKVVLSKIKKYIIIKYARIIYNGVHKDNTEEVNMKTIFINRLIILYTINQSIQALLFLTISYYISSIYCILILPGITLVYYLNGKRRYFISKIFLISYFNIIIFVASIYFSHPLLSYYYLPVIVTSTFIFNSKEVQYLFSINLISVLLILIENTSLNRFLPSYSLDFSPEKSNLIILYGNISFILCLIFLYLYYINTKAKRLINLNKNLKESKKNLEEQSRDHFLFSEASSHFLKSPIYIFNAFIDKIETGINENKSYEELKSYFSVIKHSIDEEEKFINNMFDYNKIILTTAKKTELEIISIIDSVLENFKKNYNFFYYSIYKNKEKIVVKIDQNLLEKIVLIITENAYLYNNNNDKKLEITIEETNERIKINFADNGIGINPVFREKIFKPYVRLNTLENISGTGIGLLKARKAAKLINAKITLLNSTKYGSIFQLSIKKYTNEENLNRFYRR